MNKTISKIDRKLLRNINQMALPLVLNSVTGMLIGLIDQAMVGRISSIAFGAVGLIGSTFNSIAGMLGMIAVAFNILGAKNKGEGSEENFRCKFIIGICLSLFIGIIFSLMVLFFSLPVLKFVFGLKGEILKEAMNYGKLFSLTVGLNMLLFMFSSYFKIINKTKYLFYGSTTATISNVVLNYILIFGKLGFKPMGVKGAGIASVLALTINLCIYIIVIRKNLTLKFTSEICKKRIIQNIKTLIKVSLPLMGQEVFESTLIVVCINAILTRIGVLELSVYTLLFSLVSIILMPMYSYAQTSLTMVSEYLGKRDLEKTKSIPKLCLGLSLMFCIAIAVIFLFSKNHMIRIITVDVRLVEACGIYFVYAILSNIFDVPNNIYKYSLQGMGDGAWVFLNSSTINIIGIVLIFVFSIVLKLELYGVYLGVFINLFILSLFNYVRYNTILKKSRKN
ncbi:MAG: MATE family efflux transporter [Clostridium sp.]|uniref:MATE family efflux transporter n=1 Tax=Clostridium sp. TaxID=1506 RepID=UPI003D6CBB57